MKENSFFGFATRIMNRLTFGRKMLLSAFIFSIPILLLVYFLLTEINSVIEFAAKERTGVAYILPLKKLLTETLQLREEAASGHDTSAAEGRVSAALADVERSEGSLGGKLGTKGACEELKGRLSALKGVKPTQSYSAAIDQILSTIILVADNSNLTLDPDIDSYYLMDTVSTKLPALAEVVAREKLIAARVVARGKAEPAERIALIMGAEKIRDLKEGIRKNLETAVKGTPRLSPLLTGPAADIEKRVGEFLSLVEKVDSQEAKPQDRQVLTTAADRGSEATLKAYDALLPELDKLLAVRIAHYEGKRLLNLSVCLAALLAGLYLGAGFYLSVKRNLDRMHKTAGAMADGDLTVRTAVESYDEIGSVAKDFNIMVGKLGELIAKVSEVTGKVYSSAANISGAVDNQANFSMELSSSVVEISSTMEEFSSTATQIAHNSQSVVDIADRTLVDTREGAAGVEGFTMKMSEICQENDLRIQEIVDLGRKSKEINKIMEIINNIANQTKLIAFNAALEAASAGEAGKRFGVVAVEIRRLADSVVESTSEIEGKVTEIMDAVNRLVMASEKSSQNMREGLDSALLTVSMLMNVVEGAENTNEAARQISLSTKQQQTASGQVVTALKDIQEGVRYSSEAIQKTNAVSSDLAALADGLKELMERFKVSTAGVHAEAAAFPEA